MSSVLQSPSELVPKSLKAQNAAAAKLLMSLGSIMASPVLKLQAASQDIHSAINSILKTVIDPHWSPLYFGTCWPDQWWKVARWPDLGPLVQRSEPSMGCNSCGYFCSGPLQDSARQAGFAATKAEAAKCQKYHDLQSNYHFQHVAIETTGVCMASPLPLFWVVLQRNLLMRLASPGSTSGSTRICPWPWSGETLPAYWRVCKLDLILPVPFLVALNVLTTIAACHLPLYRCVAIAFRILVLFVSFIVPQLCSVTLCIG